MPDQIDPGAPDVPLPMTSVRPALTKPVAERYAWAMNPVTSVENKAGLPLRPFRTDTNSKQFNRVKHVAVYV
jgi:hypothetical protein